MMYVRLALMMMCTFACLKPVKEPNKSPEADSMITSYCTFSLEYCPPPGSTRGEYEAAHSALDDCLTGCMATNQNDERSEEDIWRECALICDQSSYLELIPTPTSLELQVLEQ